MTPFYSLSVRIDDWRDDLTYRQPTEREIIHAQIAEDKKKARRAWVSRVFGSKIGGAF